MKRLPTHLVTACLTFLLAGCGGSGDDGPPVSSTTTREALEQLISSSATELKVETLGGEVRFWAGPYSPQGGLVGLEASAEEVPPPAYARLASRRGVSRARAEKTYRPFPNEVLSYLHYAGWMEHSLFFVSKSRLQVPNKDELFETFNYSIGSPTQTNPVSGSSTWKGVMAGFDISDTAIEGNLIEGDATVTIDDFNVPAVDVALTGLRDRNTGRSRPSMNWNDVPLSEGVFSSPVVEADFSPASSGLMGQFYGPDHEEVGGIFVRDEISGAFGAKR